MRADGGGAMTAEPEVDVASDAELVRGPGLVEAARMLASKLRERSAEIDAERRLPQDLVDAMRDAGLFHALVPASLGGAEADPVTAARVVEEVAAADGSAGWCVMLAAQSATFSGFLPEADAREVWGNGGIIAGVARPIGRAEAVTSPAEGYQVSGRWPFASGSSHANWFAGECIVYDGDEPRRDAAGNEVSRMVFVPRDEVTVHDTWHTTGLRGTASNDFSVESSFVPASRGLQVLVTEPVHPSPLFQVLALAFCNHGAHALGLGRGAVAAATEIAATKGGWGGVPLRETPRIQAVIAEATVLVEAARSHFYATLTDLWRAASAGDDTAELRARVRLAASHAGSSSLRAVDLVHHTMGTTAIFTANPLERHFRDMHTAAAHVMIGPLTYEAAGRVALGMDAAFPFF